MSILDLYCSVDAFWQQFEPLVGARAGRGRSAAPTRDAAESRARS